MRVPTVSGAALSPGKVELRLLVVLQHQHGLEQRLPAKRARRIEQFHQSLEGQVLVCIGLQARSAGTPEQFRKRRIASGAGAQHQRVDEEADQGIKSRLGPSGNRGADGDIAAAAQLAEQGSQRRLQQHEQRGALLAAEICKLGVQLSVKRRMRTAPPAKLGVSGRGRSVGRASSTGRSASCSVQ